MWETLISYLLNSIKEVKEVKDNSLFALSFCKGKHIIRKTQRFCGFFFEIDAISFHNMTFVVKSLLTRWNESTSRIHDKTICHPHITPNPIVDTCNPHRRYLHRPSQVSSFEVVVL